MSIKDTYLSRGDIYLLRRIKNCRKKTFICSVRCLTKTMYGKFPQVASGAVKYVKEEAGTRK